LLDVPLDEARVLLSLQPASTSSSSSSLSSSSTSSSSPSSSSASSLFLKTALACKSTEDICCRIITTLRRAGAHIDAGSIANDGSITDKLRTIVSQPLVDFVMSHSRRIFEAVGNGSINVLEQWLACGVDIGSCVTGDGSTLLHACVSRDSHVMLKMVISASRGSGSIVNVPASAGVTALHLASQLNRVSCVEVLLSNFAAVNIPTDDSCDGNTSLIIAAAHRSHEALAMLLSADADVFAANRLGLTVLHVAVAAGNTTALRLILSHLTTLASQHVPIQSLVNAATSYGDAPLHICALSTGIPSIQALKCSLLLLQVRCPALCS
jgi:hypothetical protein